MKLGFADSISVRYPYYILRKENLMIRSLVLAVTLIFVNVSYVIADDCSLYGHSSYGAFCARFSTSSSSRSPEISYVQNNFSNGLYGGWARQVNPYSIPYSHSRSYSRLYPSGGYNYFYGYPSRYVSGLSRGNSYGTRFPTYSYRLRRPMYRVEQVQIESGLSRRNRHNQ